MNPKKKSLGIYLTTGRDEILVHIPLRFVLEDIPQPPNLEQLKRAYLTKREEEVLHGVMEGKGNKEIAEDIHLTERTVKFHISSLLAKHRVVSRIQLYGIYANAGGERQ